MTVLNFANSSAKAYNSTLGVKGSCSFNRSYSGTSDTEGTLLDAGDTRGDTL